MSAKLLSFALLTGGVLGGTLNKRDRSIGTSYKDTSSGACFGSKNTKTTLNAGSTVWLSGSNPHSCYGNLDILGQLILSTTDTKSTSTGMTSNWFSDDDDNNILNIGSTGKVSCNDHNGGSDSGYRWNLTSMSNQGTLQWCGLSDASGSDFSLRCDKTSYNYGLIDWAQYGSHAADSDCCWQSTTLKGPGQSSYDHLYNYGAFRLTNTVFRGRQNIYGDGCFVLGEQGVLYLEDGAGYYQNPTKGPCYPDHSICFTHKTATLHLDSQVYTTNANFGPKIFGFGPGNAIEFEETIQSMAYNTITGVLTVTLSSAKHPVYIKLGLGYSPSSFYTAKNPSSYCKDGYNAIYYSKACPSQATPTKCAVSAATCTDPASTAGPFTATTKTGSTTRAATTSPKASTTSKATSTTQTSSGGAAYTVDPVLATPPSRSKTTTRTTTPNIIPSSTTPTYTIATDVLASSTHGTSPSPVSNNEYSNVPTTTVVAPAPTSSQPNPFARSVDPNQCVC